VDLRGANLASAKLRETNLRGANLERANLRGADLVGAILRQASLAKADLREANLSNAELQRADKPHLFLRYPTVTQLVEANLSHANLAGADLSGANLEAVLLVEANLTKTKFTGAHLNNADLRKAVLRETDFSAAKFKGADLSATQLTNANLAETELSGANLQGVSLRNADLHDFLLRDVNLGYANLADANLAGADLKQANLEHAQLFGTNLAGTRMAGAILSYAWFEPKSVEGLFIFGAKDLSTIRFRHPAAAANLRALTQELALRSETRALTSALTKFRLQGDSVWAHFVEAYVKGGVISDFGANPVRLLWGLLISVVVFSPIYFVVLWRRDSRSGIWRDWSPDRPLSRRRQSRFERLRADRWWEAVLWALYFSLLSGFHFGWRGLSFGNWIARLQWDEYLLRGTGWIRTVSGLQSIIAFYLLALWVLTYFTPWFD
jgi:uncharacterized protein YjbI with pentapeptide repeats